jgi:ArsR family transcriptional regulator
MTKRGPARDEDLEQLTNLLRLLSDKTRLNILSCSAAANANVSSLCDSLRLPQPTVSHHLGLLRMSNIITGRRDGKQVFYGLDGRVNTERECLEIGAGTYSVLHRPYRRSAQPS